MKSDVEQAYVFAVRNHIETTFIGASLKDCHESTILYHIPLPSASWSHIFKQMEESRSLYQIEDYSVSQTTLEGVFINFARSNQQDVNTLKKSFCFNVLRHLKDNCFRMCKRHPHHFRYGGERIDDLLMGEPTFQMSDSDDEIERLLV